MLKGKKWRVSLLFTLVLIVVCSIYLTISTSLAFGIYPSKVTIDLDPGETKELEITLSNSEDTAYALELKQASITLENGQTVYSETDADVDLDSEPSYSLRPYMSVEKDTTQVLNPGEQESVTIIVSAPEDIVPGTYLGAYFVSKATGEAASDTGGSAGVKVKGRIAYTITANIGVENAKEELTLDKFEINQEKLDSGILEVNSEFTNKGDFSSTPTGSITFYNAESHEQVKNVLRETQIVGNEVITKDFKDELPFNKKQTGVYPGATAVITTVTDSNSIINLTPGKYYAQLQAFYGLEGEKLEAKTDVFEIREIVYIDSFSANKDSVFNKSVNFEGAVINNGQSTIDLGGNIYITNMFGQNVDIINLPQQKVLAGGTYGLQQEWFAEKGLGLYFATVSLKFNDTALEKTVKLYHFDALQIVIVLVVIIVLIVIITFGIRSYLKLKKKVDQKKE